MINPNKILCTAMLALCLVWPICVSAQLADENPLIPDTLNKISPKKAPEYFDKGKKPAKKKEKAVPNAERVLAPSLNGIVLVADEAKVIKKGLESLPELKNSKDKIVAIGFDVPGIEALKEKLAPFMGKPLTMKIWTREITKAIVLHYRSQDRIVVDVYSPIYESKEGVIQFICKESRFGELKIQGGEWFPEKLYRDNFRIKYGGSILDTVMQDDVAWINRNPFRKVDVILEQGSQEGTTDAVLMVDDRVPVRFFGAYNDGGNRLTGYDTYMAGFNWGKAFNQDLSLNYQHTRRSNATYFKSHVVDLSKPLPWRHILSMNAFYAGGDMDARRISTVALTALDTVQWGATMSYHIPQVFQYAQGKSKWSDSLSFGFGYGRYENGNAILGIQQAGQKVDVVDMQMAYQTAYSFERGSISNSSTIIYSPGKIGGHNKKQATGYVGDPEYFVYLQQLRLSYALPQGLSMDSSVKFQISSDQLVGNRSFSVGGAGSVRGYDGGEGSGEEGVVWQSNLYSPGMKLFNRIYPDKFQQENLRFLSFFDYGDLTLKNPLSTEDAHKSLMSVGGGAQYTISNHFTFSFEYGFQLKDSDAGQTQRNTRNQRGHISLSVSY